MPLHFEAKLALVDVFATASLADLASIIADQPAPAIAANSIPGLYGSDL